MDSWIVFFDDSGTAYPGSKSEFFSFAVVAMPMNVVPHFTRQWKALLRPFPVDTSRGMPELHCSDLYNRWLTLRSGKPLPADDPFVDCTTDDLSALIHATWELLVSLPSAVYLGTVTHKETYWRRFHREMYQDYLEENDTKAKQKIRKRNLELCIQDTAFTYLLQRIQYLMEDCDGICVVIGDENKYQPDLYAAHGRVKDGHVPYTNAPRIVTNVVFGSSQYTAGIQAADWVGFALQHWARGAPFTQGLLANLIPHFRGYPNQVRGRGIVLLPDNYPFPSVS